MTGVPGVPGVPGLSRLDHVGIAVRDIDRAVADYQALFAAQLVHTEELPDLGVRVAFLETAPESPSLELICPLSETGPVARFLARRGDGLHHLAYAVDDLEEAMASLLGRGYTFTGDGPRPGARGHRVAFLRPAHAAGVLIELVTTRG